MLPACWAVLVAAKDAEHSHVSLCTTITAGHLEGQDGMHGDADSIVSRPYCVPTMTESMRPACMAYAMAGTAACILDPVIHS